MEETININLFLRKLAHANNQAFRSSSVMGEGIAELVEDAEGKKQALSILMKTQTGKDFTFDDRMVSVVTCIKICVTDFTAKKRPLPMQQGI